MKTRFSAASAIAAVALFLSAFFGQGNAIAQPVVPNPIPFMAGQVTPDTGACVYSYDLPTRVSCAAGLVNDQLLQLYGATPSYTYIHDGAVGLTQIGIDNKGEPIACGYVSAVIENMYCGGSINFGEHDLSFAQWRTSDPQLAVALTAAHESGHFIQTRFGLVNLTPIFTDARVFPFEEQSDCVAGVIAARWVEQGNFPDTARNEGAAYFASLGVEGELSHGGPEQRQDAFLLGYDGEDVQTCGNPALGLR